MNKIHKLVMLPSNNENRIESHIYKFIGEPNSLMDKRVKGQLIYTASPNKKEYEAYNLYVLSDEEIKDDDYYFDYIYKSIFKPSKTSTHNGGNDYKKVIATTDKSLVIKYDERFTDVIVNGKSINTQLPQIPQSFVEHFITEYNKGNLITEVEVEYDLCDYDVFYDRWKLKVNQDNTINIKTIETKLYTKEEVIKLLLQFNNDKPGIFDCSNWIKQNL